MFIGVNGLVGVNVLSEDNSAQENVLKLIQQNIVLEAIFHFVFAIIIIIY